MIKKIKVDTVILRKYCDDCDVEMVKDGNVFLSDPPKYAYTCPKCSKREISSENCPAVDYEVKGTIFDVLKRWFNFKTNKNGL
jgi:hypothetical protein